MDGVRPVDPWSWVAWLTDETQVREAEDHGWADVPAEQVMAVELVPIADSHAPIVLEVPAGATAGLERVRQVRYSPSTGEHRMDGSVTRLWWQQDDHGVWIHVQDDGRVVVATRRLPLE